MPREIVEAYFLWLAREGLEREFSHVWDSLASSAVDIEALQVFPELRRAYDEGLIEPGFMSASDLDEVEAGPRGKWIEHYRETYPPISDVAEATSWWQCFSESDRSTVANSPIWRTNTRITKQCEARRQAVTIPVPAAAARNTRNAVEHRNGVRMGQKRW